MSGWSIQIPYRHRSDPLSTVGELANRLEADEDCATARQLVLSAAMAGLSTAGQLVDRIEALDQGERRGLLDAARQLAGLKSASDIESREHFDRLQHAARLRSANETRPLRLAVTPSGAIIDLNERDDEIARAQVEDESRRRVHEERLAERAVEAAARRQHDEARDAAFRTGIPPGVPG